MNNKRTTSYSGSVLWRRFGVSGIERSIRVIGDLRNLYQMGARRPY